ncbi:MAG: hypothetical protein MI743_11570 [Sneathiellales bacterium]|nr:hypothetical protein [Sneathiellales bacterium]
MTYTDHIEPDRGPLNKKILVAGLLSLLGMVIHAVVGGDEVRIPLDQSDLSVLIRSVSNVVWFFTTGILTINGIALIIAAFHMKYRIPLILMVCSQYLVLSVLFIGYGMFQMDNPADLPQWVLFVVIMILALLGLRDKPRKM